MAADEPTTGREDDERVTLDEVEQRSREAAVRRDVTEAVEVLAPRSAELLRRLGEA